MSGRRQNVPKKPPRKSSNEEEPVVDRGQDDDAEGHIGDYKEPPSKPKSAVLPETQRVENTYLHSCSIPQFSVDRSTSDFLVEIPKDVSGLTVDEVVRCLRCLNLSKHVETFLAEQIDGELLMSIDREMLIEELGFKRFEALKLEKFTRHGWRPKTVRTVYAAQS